MTGIAQLFAELSGDEPDWFQMQFWFERQYEIQLEQKRDNERRRYRVVKSVPARHQQRLEANRPRMRDWWKRKAMDAEYMEKRRKETRERMARLRSAKKEKVAA